MSPSVLLVLVFFTSVLFVAAVGYLFAGNTSLVKQRLRAIQEGEASHLKEGRVEGAFLVKWVEPVGKLVLPDEDWKKSIIRRRLVFAGYRSHRAPYIYAAVKVAFLLLFPLAFAAGAVAMSYYPLREVGGLLLLFLSGLVGFYLPDIVLSAKASERMTAVREQFPDAIDLMVVCVEAGLSLDSAIQRVGKEIEHSHPEMGEELTLVGLEMKAGRTKREALEGLAERTGLQEVKALVSVLVQAETYGTSIGASLVAHADELREIRIQTAREKAAKLPVKLVIPIMIFIFPALFLVVLGPALVSMMRAVSDV